MSKYAEQSVRLNSKKYIIEYLAYARRFFKRLSKIAEERKGYDELVCRMMAKSLSGLNTNGDSSEEDESPIDKTKKRPGDDDNHKQV